MSDALRDYSKESGQGAANFTELWAQPDQKNLSVSPKSDQTVPGLPQLEFKERAESPFPPTRKIEVDAKPGIQKLNTGDTLISNGDQQCLILEDGTKVWVRENSVKVEGSTNTHIDLNDKNRSASADEKIGVYQEGGTTTIRFPDGKTLEVDKNGIKRLSDRNLTCDVTFRQGERYEPSKEELQKAAEELAKHIAEHGYLTPEAIARLQMNPPAGARLPRFFGDDKFELMDLVNEQLKKVSPELQLSVSERCMTPPGAVRGSDPFAVSVVLSRQGKPVQSAYMYTYHVNI